MADKIVKAKQPEKTKQADAAQAEKPRQLEKSKPVQKPAAKPAEKDKERDSRPNALVRWYRETVGELRKVSWPSVQDTRRLTVIVLVVMFLMSAVLGLLDFLFSTAITLLIS